METEQDMFMRLWIDWEVASGEDPAQVAMALQATGLSLAEFGEWHDVHITTPKSVR
jgi:hypothetical protein